MASNRNQSYHSLRMIGCDSEASLLFHGKCFKMCVLSIKCFICGAHVK